VTGIGNGLALRSLHPTLLNLDSTHDKSEIYFFNPKIASLENILFEGR